MLGFITLLEVYSVVLWLFFITFENKEMIPLVKYDVTVSFMAHVLDTVTYLVPQVLDTAS